MSDEIYCNLCSRRITTIDSNICKKCGLVICPFCLAEGTIKFGKTLRYKCNCGSDEILSFNDMRTQLVEDLLNLRTKIRHSVYLPVKFNRRWENLTDNIRMNLAPQVAYDFRKVNLELRDITLNSVQKFIFSKLEEISSKIKDSYKRIIENLSMTNVTETNELRLDMRFYEDLISNFQTKVKEILEPFQEECNLLEEEYKRLLALSSTVRTYKNGLLSLLEPMEMIADKFESISFKDSSIFWHDAILLITLNRILFLQKSKIRKRYKTILEILPDEIADIKSLSEDKLLIHLLSKKIKISSSKFDISRLYSVLRRFHLSELSNYKPRGSITSNSLWNMDSYELKLKKYLTFYVFKEIENSENVKESSEINNYIVNKLQQLIDKKRVIHEVLRDLREERSRIHSVDYYRILEEYQSKLNAINNEISKLNRNNTRKVSKN